MVPTIPRNRPTPMPAAVNRSVVNNTRTVEVKTMETLLRWRREATAEENISSILTLGAHSADTPIDVRKAQAPTHRESPFMRLHAGFSAPRVRVFFFGAGVERDRRDG